MTRRAMLKRVLIADDYPPLRKAVRSWLEKRPDLEVCAQLGDGRQAVDVAVAVRPDLLVLDFQMPGLNGVEVAGIVKKRIPASKVILFTMHARELGQSILSVAGIDRVLSKTNGISELLPTVESLLGLQPIQDRNIDVFVESAGGAGNILTDGSSKADWKQALEECEGRFHSAFEQTAVGMGYVSSDGKWLRVNRKFCEMLGYNQGEMRDLTVKDLMHPEDLEAEHAQFSKSNGGELDHYSLDQRYLRKDGSPLWVHVTVDAVRNAENKLLYCLRVAQDDGPRLEAQAKLEKAMRDWQVASRHFELLTERMAASVTRCSRDLHYLWVNQSYANWLKRPADKIMGRPISDVLGAEAFKKLEPRFEQVLSGVEVAYEETLGLDGIGSRSISAVYRPTVDQRGVSDGWVALVEDVTDDFPVAPAQGSSTVVTGEPPVRKRFLPGETVPQTAIYIVVHYRHRAPHQVTLRKSDIFPRCTRGGDRVRFEFLAGGTSSLTT